ncbi:hypothetical protein ACFPRL_34620 [Pseudoclavibacter helvolus]
MSVAPAPTAMPVAATSAVRMTAVPVAVSQPKNADPNLKPPNLERSRSRTSSRNVARSSTGTEPAELEPEGLGSLPGEWSRSGLWESWFVIVPPPVGVARSRAGTRGTLQGLVARSTSRNAVRRRAGGPLSVNHRRRSRNLSRHDSHSSQGPFRDVSQARVPECPPGPDRVEISASCACRRR